jgi:NAD(P)-dependent dehydrogenase (short-subunit alcohol dehydrogenase family)
VTELAGLTALVTGGTAGIGFETARLLAAEGASVTITGRSAERGAAAAAELGVRFIAADLADLESVKSLARQCGDADIVVNNAASFPGALTVEQDVATFESTFDTNVRGAYFLVAALVPGMLRRGRGSIVNVTSMVAFKGVPGASSYSASKAALESLTRTWATEFGPQGVRVNSVAPGPTATPGVAANGATPTTNWVVRCRWAARHSRPRSPRPCCSSHRRGRVSSPGRRCMPMAAARPPDRRKRPPDLLSGGRSRCRGQ